MSSPCLFASDACWRLQPLSAPVTAGLWIVLATCATLVAAATLPGKTRILLGAHESGGPGWAAVRLGSYVAWMLGNVAIAWALWFALFPSASPRSLVAYDGAVAVGLPCVRDLLDTRCLQARVKAELGETSPSDSSDTANALLQLADDPTSVAGRRIYEIGDDVAAYVQLLQVPVSDIFLVGKTESSPTSGGELATQWPMIDRYLRSLDGTPRSVESLPPIEITSLSECVPTRPLHPHGGLRVHFCTLPSTPHIQEILSVYSDGANMIVEVGGVDLPTHIFVRLGDTDYTPVAQLRAGGRQALLVIEGAGHYVSEKGLLRVALSSIDTTGPAPVTLPLAPNALCLRSEGSGISDADLATLPTGLKSRARNLLEGSCADGMIYVAANGAIVRGRFAEVRAQAMANALQPIFESKVEPARILNPAFDTSPGLLDDRRLANWALNTKAFLADPIVVREVPDLVLHQGRKRFVDAWPKFFAERTRALAPIVAKVESYEESSWTGTVLAGAFGQALKASDERTKTAAWGALVTMAEFEGVTSSRVHPSERTRDRLGAVIEGATTSRRYRIAFLAFASWLLVKFIMQRLVR